MSRHRLFTAILLCPLISALFVDRLPLGHAYRLPDTGQTKCYDDLNNAIKCPSPGEKFYGQDGNYLGPLPAYRDNGDGTVSDLKTGLMWEQGDTQNERIGRSWPNALDYCSSLGLANHSDWRLPTRTELLSIVNYGRYSPSIDISVFPNCRAYGYWSSTVWARTVNSAWNVGFYTGGAGPSSKSNQHLVRCVRDEP